MSDAADIGPSDRDVVYGPSPGQQGLMIIGSLGSGLFTFYIAYHYGAWPALEALLLWSPGAPLPNFLPLIFVLLGLVSCGVAIQNIFYIGRSLPRLTVTRDGVILETSSGFAGTRTSWAKWNSLTRFGLNKVWLSGYLGERQRWAYVAVAVVTGTEASEDLQRSKRFNINDQFDASLEQIIAAINLRLETTMRDQIPKAAPPSSATAA